MWAFLRLLRALWAFGPIFASYMFQLGLQRVFGRKRKWLQGRWKGLHKRNARRLTNGCIRLRGVFIKLGQTLSIMGTFLPRVFTAELEKLQDEVPPRPYKKIRKALERSLGGPPEKVFETFSKDAVAAASLGQVHEAKTLDGHRVAVKVLYPNVQTIIKVDLIVVRWAMKVYRRFVPIRQIMRVHDQLTDMLDRETNLVHEAKCLERMAANFEDDPDVLFPAVHHDLSSERVMTMTFMDGVKISRATELEEMGLDPYDVASKLVKVFYKQLFFDMFFHADPHPGNFFVQRGPEGQPRIVVLDFGAATEVRENLVDGMLDVLSGVMGRSDDLVVKGIETMGFMSANGNRDLLERTIRKYFEKLLNLDIQDFSKIDAQVATSFADPEVKKAELRELMKSVEFPLGWFFVERAVVILFGLSAQLAPKLNTMQVGFPYIMKFIADNRERMQRRQLPAAG
jgi:predicted unusual protein kinase regulating ubiquinone biosynthesis (AarF/ABC1/UbiB family)